MAATFFRDPARRAVSDFFYTAVDAVGAQRKKQGAFGMPAATIQSLHEAVGRGGSGGGDPTARVQRFLAWPGIAGCQAKLLLGRECHARDPLNDITTFAAIATLH